VHKVCAKLEQELPAGHLRIATDLGDGIDDVTFAIEAIAEDLAAKRELLGRLEGRLDPAAVLATTTSSLPLAVLAEASGRPERFVAFHVFHPVARMELIELAFPRGAERDTRARAHALAAALGKRAVEVPDCAGFVVNRLLFPYLFDAVALTVEKGMAPADVDTCMTLGAGHPMGPLALLDYVGLDVALAIGDSLGLDVPGRVRELVAQGALGRKAGRGFYVYE
jgi:3-hydroxybutyryl-CoA dehydrogenase